MPSFQLAALPVLLALLVSLAPAADSGAGASPRFDCNENGVDDAVDIALGTSGDADANGIPDECEDRQPAG